MFANKIKNLLRLFYYSIFLYPLYIISNIFPRNKRIWIFGSHNNTFSDNSKYFFLYVSDNFSNIVKAVWISGNKYIVRSINKSGYRCYYKWSLKGLWFSLRGYIYIYSAYSSDINFFTSGGAIRFNLWHGIPLKKIEYDINKGTLGTRYKKKYFFMFLYPDNFQKPHFILSTTHLMSMIISNAFKVGMERCVELGYPRCEHFAWNKTCILEYLKNKEKDIYKYLNEILFKYKNIMMYVPTFRESSTNDISQVLDLYKLDKILTENNSLLLIKQHPKLLDINLGQFRNIAKLSNKMDIYMILPFVDMLITDYSSVMFDFMLLNRPVILYQYDKNYYEYYERGFYTEIKKIVEDNFLIVENFTELLDKLTNININVSYNSEAILKLWPRDINCSEKLFNYLLKKI